MPNYVFEKFEEVEESIRRLAPKIVYKYRADWTNQYHRQIITDKILWFAAPRYLNDPYDIRTPLQFDIAEIDSPIFFEKLKAHYISDHPNIAYTERDLNVICENKMDEIRMNPQKYFENNYKQIREGTIYDRVGIFSCTKDELNETMWAHYSNNHQGFVIGFVTVELARDLLCSIGPMTYNDTIPVYSFIDPKADDDFNIYFLKSKKWEHEQEFRFYTIGDDENIERAKKYSVACASELLLGIKFPDSQKNDIITEAKRVFGNTFPIYHVRPKISGYGLEKTQIA
jgi:hypothetical protein